MFIVEEGVSKISVVYFVFGGIFFMGDVCIGSDFDMFFLQLFNMVLNSVIYGVLIVGDFLCKDKGYDWG